MPQKNRTVKGVLGGLLGLVGLSAVAGLLVAASVTPVLAMAGITGSRAFTLFEELPENLKVTSPMGQTTIYVTGTDGKPTVLTSFYEQNRQPVTFDQVAPVMYDAILSSEDKDFYTHGGVNLGATIKALVENLAKTSDRGASTITQQYVKNVRIQECEQGVDTAAEDYDTQIQQCWMDAAVSTGNDGIERKLQEMRYALQIEKEYSKNDILIGYLNLSNFGGTVYGIEAAADYYFSTTAAKLTLAQAATIAGMVQEPNKLRIDLKDGTYTKDDVAHNSEADGYADTLERRNYVLQQMLVNGKITQEQHDEAVATPVTPNIHRTTQGCAAAGDSAYFCQYVKSVIESDTAFGDSPEERRATLRQGGLDIYTTLDMRLQNPTIEAVQSRVPQTWDGISLGGTGVSIEASTGRILAMAQNTKFSEAAADEGKPGISAQAFAADLAHGGANGFETGSTYKLFTLLEWLKTGHSINQTLDGRSRVISPFTQCGDTRTNSEKVGNFGGGGGSVSTVARFTAQSLNTGFLAMAQQLDLCDINETAKSLGVHYGDGGDVTTDGEDPNGPFATVLGSKSIAPLQMAGAYATVANGGTYCEPKVIDKIVGEDGTEMTPPATTCSEVLSTEVAAAAAQALRGVMNGGTGSGANPYDGVPVIGKTGTAETSHTMLVESSTKVTTAVWVGNITGRKDLRQFYPNGTRAADIRYSMARAIQGAANDIYGGDDFPRATGTLVRQVLTDVPSVVGLSVDEATEKLEDAGFSATTGPEVDSDLAKGLVAAQSPEGQAPLGTSITLSPSNGKASTVPAAVIGQSRNEAQNTLFGAGFTSVAFDNSCSANGAKVTKTSPGAGKAASKSTTIQVSCE